MDGDEDGIWDRDEIWGCGIWGKVGDGRMRMGYSVNKRIQKLIQNGLST